MTNPITDSTNDPTGNHPVMPTITPRCPRTDAPAATISGYAACSVLELLELCDLFLRTATPATRAELTGFLDQQPTGLDANLLIDLLGLNALYLDGIIALADTGRTTRTTGDQGPGTRRTA
jgi:hypothetical protein